MSTAIEMLLQHYLRGEMDIECIGIRKNFEIQEKLLQVFKANSPNQGKVNQYGCKKAPN